MALTLYYHPFSRATTVVWMLEEIGQPYSIQFVDMLTGAHKHAGMIAKNPMGKLPIIVDGDIVVAETAAIGLYLADKYKLGTLAPLPTDAARAAYLQWSVFAPSVMEPACMTELSKWEAKPSTVGWGDYATMLDAIDTAIANKQYLLGDGFSMADIIFGATLRFMLRFKMIESRSTFEAYVDRISARPASRAADKINADSIAEHGLDK